jgi:hypothetical protein
MGVRPAQPERPIPSSVSVLGRPHVTQATTAILRCLFGIAQESDIEVARRELVRFPLLELESSPPMFAKCGTSCGCTPWRFRAASVGHRLASWSVVGGPFVKPEFAHIFFARHPQICWMYDHENCGSGDCLRCAAGAQHAECWPH